MPCAFEVSKFALYFVERKRIFAYISGAVTDIEEYIMTEVVENFTYGSDGAISRSIR